MFLDLWAALLPSPERDDLVRRGADPSPWSFALGLAQLFVGGALLFADALGSIQEMSNAVATYVFEEMDPRLLNSPENRMAITSSGALMWLTWAARPTTWLLASVPLVGIVRMVSFGINREAFGEPAVWLVLRLSQAVRRFLAASRDRVRFGVARPDRLVVEPGWDLIVLSCQPKPDWNERVTLEINQRFYRLHRVEERQDGAWWAWAYLLKEAPENEIIRSLIRYEPPQPTPPAKDLAPPQDLLTRASGAGGLCPWEKALPGLDRACVLQSAVSRCGHERADHHP